MSIGKYLNEIYIENKLLQNLDKIHTTKLGEERIKKNLKLTIDNIIVWCRDKIKEKSNKIVRKGKNWYITGDDYEITINAYSYTVITAHKLKMKE